MCGSERACTGERFLMFYMNVLISFQGTTVNVVRHSGHLEALLFELATREDLGLWC